MTTTEPTVDDLLGALINAHDDLRDILDNGQYTEPSEVKRDVRLIFDDVKRALKRAGIERD